MAGGVVPGLSTAQRCISPPQSQGVPCSCRGSRHICWLSHRVTSGLAGIYDALQSFCGALARLPVVLCTPVSESL